MTADDVAALIRAGLPQATVRILTDDDTHFEAVVVTPEFAGKRSIARHQLVYAALGARMGREIHALSIKAFTPEEWAAARAGAPS
jgi:acid stress-induced BolA-like protein IbaG/YrbA